MLQKSINSKYIIEKRCFEDIFLRICLLNFFKVSIKHYQRFLLYQLTLASYAFQYVYSFRCKFMKKILIPTFLFFGGDIQLRFYCVRLFYLYASTSSTVTDDVTKLFMYRIFNTNYNSLLWFFLSFERKI